MTDQQQPKLLVVFYEVPNNDSRRPTKTSSNAWLFDELPPEMQALASEIAQVQDIRPPFEQPNHVTVAARHYHAMVSMTTGPYMGQQPIAFGKTPDLWLIVATLKSMWEHRAEQLTLLSEMKLNWQHRTKNSRVLGSREDYSSDITPEEPSNKAPMTTEALISELESILVAYYTDDDPDGDAMATELSLLLGKWHSSHK